nr:lytic transglycosylase domain-containing protein [Pantoea agglomerans]
MVNPNDRHALNVLKSHVADANYKSGLPAGMLPAVAGAESGWDFRAISAAGAGGLFQFTKDTASRYGLSDADRFNPDKSTQAASRYFQDNLRRYHGDIAETLAQYNGGNVAVNKDGNLNVKLETIRYLEKLLPQIRGGEEQHTGLMGRLRAAEQQLNGNRDQRVTVQLDINHNPGADINASVQSQYIPH